ncbi:MAG: rRNA ((1518)-N(6)/adenine(1519)-N(6))-dimethyltransferase RsmA [Verrucomicrobiota bacterium]
MTITAMRETLDRRGIQLTRSLGQNFLHDANQLRRIVAAAELTPADKVLEIGPGLGPLTELLLEKADEVFAIEKDARLVDFLVERFGLNVGTEPSGASPAPPEGGTPNLSLLHDDALDFLQREPRDWRDWKLVANLPYSVASPILVELAEAPHCPARLVATLQFEVAKRLMAGADDDDYGVLTLLLQLRYEPRGLFKIPAECFFPAPDVESACVTLDCRAVPLLPLEQHATFKKIVKRAFSQRRKMMLKLLKSDWPLEKLQAAFAALQISPMERAEKVSLAKFVELTKALAKT